MWSLTLRACAPFGAARYDRERLSNPYGTHDLCPADFCSSSRIWPDIRTSMTESVIHLGDNMETIEDVERLGTVLANEAQIGLPHI